MTITFSIVALSDIPPALKIKKFSFEFKILTVRNFCLFLDHVIFFYFFNLKPFLYDLALMLAFFFLDTTTFK